MLHDTSLLRGNPRLDRISPFQSRFESLTRAVSVQYTYRWRIPLLPVPSGNRHPLNVTRLPISTSRDHPPRSGLAVPPCKTSGNPWVEMPNTNAMQKLRLRLLFCTTLTILARLVGDSAGDPLPLTVWTRHKSSSISAPSM
jgi:hypothetical protein